MKQKPLFDPEPFPWELADQDDLLCAQVVLNRPLEQAYDYLVPDNLRGKIQIGQRVRVPFGRGDQLLTGFCVGLGPPRTDIARLKRVHELLDAVSLLSPHMLKLTKWIAEYYLCGWGQVLEMVIPAGVKNQAGTKEILFLRVNPEAASAVPSLPLPAKQATVLELVRSAPQPLTIDAVARLAQCGTGPITALRRKRLIEAYPERVASAPESVPAETLDDDLQMNADQQQVLDRVLDTLRNSQYRTFLLQGVTGSGKTEVYIRAIREVVSYGRQAIVLVPEISLTPQTIRRFRRRFPHVAVLHSHLNDVERNRHWRQIAQGQVQVVVGARSAIFAPTPNLGLIIIDEEHETSFKQDTVPRYHAREVARQRAELENIPLILGSATPTLESWQRTSTGQDELLQMPRRVLGLPMPPVVIVDVRHDPVISAGAAIGRALRTAMLTALEREGQVILFLNLRGFSPVMFCRACGQSVKCPHCDVTMTWHKELSLALCHSCEYTSPPPLNCPYCGKPGIRYLGTGTQRLEQEVRAKFSKYSCMRMDSDSMRQPGSHDRALEAFRRGETRILLGTQMISKGLDFPNVTLVGVIDADTMLHQPDLRSTERTFHLIAQVAGRTGRSSRGGRVLVQTCSPTEPAIVLAAQHNFTSFAKHELAHRRQLQYPPFQHLVRVIFRSENEQLVRTEVQRVATLCLAEIGRLRVPIRLLGPAPAPVAKVKQQFRYHFNLAAVEVSPLHELWHAVAPQLHLAPAVEATVDVDPLNLR